MGVVLVIGLIALIGLITFARDRGSEVRVLFVGNSYTSYNDLPGMVAELAASAGTRMTVAVIAPGGAWLIEHSRSPQTVEAITDGDFDFVVLQEQSMAPAYSPVARDSTYPAVASLAQLVAGAGSDLVLFQTWGHRGGNSQVGHGSYESMQDAITATYTDLAVRYTAAMAPAGEAWRAHFTSGSTTALHDPDGSHPNVHGSFLAAAVIAATITDVDPASLSWTGPIDAASAAILLQSAQAALSP